MIGKKYSLIEYLETQDENLEFELKEHRKKRSLDANAYFWVLLQELCDNIGVNTIDEYKRRAKELGVFRIMSIEAKDVPTIKKVWEEKGTAWPVEIFDTEYYGEKEFKILHLYYGSSSYSTKQMSRLIDGVVQDCKSIGIETKSEAEIKSLLESWK